MAASTSLSSLKRSGISVLSKNRNRQCLHINRHRFAAKAARSPRDQHDDFVSGQYSVKISKRLCRCMNSLRRSASLFTLGVWSYLARRMNTIRSSQYLFMAVMMGGNSFKSQSQSG